MLDAGHTPKNTGVISARAKPEYSYNKNIVALLKKELLSSGFKQVFTTNEQGSEISLASRAALANSMHANIFVSIHHDSVQARYLSEWTYNNKTHTYSDRFKGYSVFFSRHNPQAAESSHFAQLLGSELRSKNFIPTMHHTENIAGENRTAVDEVKGVFEHNNLAVLKRTNMPAILLECGIIVNRKEEILLSGPAYQSKIVTALSQAIKNYCQKSI